MKKLRMDEAAAVGLPLFEMKTFYEAAGPGESIKFSLITMPPGVRVPAEGMSEHAEDEYSFFIDGELYTESGDFKGISSKGDFSFIPKGERHWCENRTDKPCVLLCAQVK